MTDQLGAAAERVKLTGPQRRWLSLATPDGRLPRDWPPPLKGRRWGVDTKMKRRLEELGLVQAWRDRSWREANYTITDAGRRALQ